MNKKIYNVAYYSVKKGHKSLNAFHMVSYSTYLRKYHLWADNTPDNVRVLRETSPNGIEHKLTITFYE